MKARFRLTALLAFVPTLLVACGGSNSVPPPAPIRFDLSDAIGVASGAGPEELSPSTATVAPASLSPGLLKVLSDFTSHPAITQGDPIIHEYYVLGDALLLAGYAYLDDIGTGCALTKVMRGDDEGECLDPELGEFVTAWSPGQRWGIQFDDNGSMYYAGRLRAPGSEQNTEFDIAIRKYSANSASTLIVESGGAQYSNFVVAGDGTVYLAGTTYLQDITYGTEHWLRRLTVSGSLETVLDHKPSLLTRFPDGHIYFNEGGALKRILSSTHTIDPDYDYYAQDNVPHVDHVRLFRSETSVLAFTGSALAELYPTPQVLTTGIDRVRLVERGQDGGFAIAGRDENGRYSLVYFDPATGASRDLLGDDEVDIDSIAVMGHVVTFWGLRYSDASRVRGEYDLTTGTLRFGGEDQMLSGFMPFER